MKTRLSDSRGTSASEVLVSMLITVMMAAAGLSFYRSEARELFDQAADHHAMESARAALEFMARDLRRAGLDPAREAFATLGVPITGATGISVAEAGRIRVEADRDGSGAIDPGAVDPRPEVVEYAYEAATRRIVRTVAGTSRTLIHDVPAGGLSFRYLDHDRNVLSLTGTPLELTASQRDSIAMVQIHLQVEAVGARELLRRNLSTRVMLRNRALGQL